MSRRVFYKKERGNVSRLEPNENLLRNEDADAKLIGQGQET